MKHQSPSKGRKSLRFDIILIASLLALSLFAVLLLFLTREEGNGVVVEIDGEKVAEYALSEEGEYPLNGGTNVLVIADGKAYFSHADCPDQTCVKTGKIQYVGESIVCLPNRVVVRVVGAERQGGVDIAP